MESRPSFGRHIAALEHPKSTHHPCLVRASTVSCADAGEGSHFDGGLESQNYARIFTVNEASGSSNDDRCELAIKSPTLRKLRVGETSGFGTLLDKTGQPSNFGSMDILY